MAFCLQRLTDQADLTEGILVPVWNFYGDIISHWADGSANHEWGRMYPQIVLSVNAVNGNIIQTDKGY